MKGSEQNIPQICARHGCRKQALRKFCSVACRVAHHNSRRARASKVRITCLGCGKVFQGVRIKKPAGQPADQGCFVLKNNRKQANKLQVAAARWSGAH